MSTSVIDKPRILSTRILTPELEARFAEQLAIAQRDFIVTRALDFSFELLHQQLLFTSQNAVKSVLKHPNILDLKQKEVFCVGVNTKALLEENGWTVLAWADYAKDLAPQIVKNFPQATISFFNGNLRRPTLPEAFAQAAIVFNEFQVYQTVLKPQLISEKLDGICFYSPSAIESYLQLNTIGEATCFCIGDTTAQALDGITTKRILAAQPTVEATLDACANYYK